MKTNLSSGVPRGLLCVFEFLLSNCRVVGIKECTVVFLCGGSIWGGCTSVRYGEIFGIFALMVHFGARLTAF